MTGFPTVMLIQRVPELQIIKYKGMRTKTDILSFVQEYVHSSSSSSQKKGTMRGNKES